MLFFGTHNRGKGRQTKDEDEYKHQNSEYLGLNWRMNRNWKLIMKKLKNLINSNIWNQFQSLKGKFSMKLRKELVKEEKEFV